MANRETFNQVIEHHLETLRQYVPIVSRVHGASHPEFYEVHKVFDAINLKLKAAESELPDLKAEFASLREITNNYTIPEDVCESYEAVYNMLGEIDRGYNA